MDIDYKWEMAVQDKKIAALKAQLAEAERRKGELVTQRQGAELELNSSRGVGYDHKTGRFYWQPPGLPFEV